MAVQLYRGGFGGPLAGDGYGYGVVGQSIHPAAMGPMAGHAIPPISRSYISPYATPIGPAVAAPVAAAPVAPIAPVTGYYGHSGYGHSGYGHSGYGLCPGCYGCPTGGNDLFLWTACCCCGIFIALIIIALVVVLILWATDVI
ncbi:uncharacterized protein [Apostichopus japonicus]|uniref:uncharacterized protein isoform X2 n=1 Tax=Stichopus japonicus TaxID=307972 RepID=UPI003AB1E44A